MGDCYLEGFGACDPKLSGEHGISAGVLRILSSDKTVKVGGFPWQTPFKYQNIGIGSLRAKVLCVKHNSALNPLDDEAILFTGALIKANSRISELPPETLVSGPKLERWLLKVLISSASANSLSCKPIAPIFKTILLGAEWPHGLGLYAGASETPEIFTRDILLETFTTFDHELVSASFRIAGVKIWLLLRNPPQPHRFGIHHPRGFVFETKGPTRRIKLTWDGPSSNEAVIYTLLGHTDEPAPHTIGWEQA